MATVKMVLGTRAEGNTPLPSRSYPPPGDQKWSRGDAGRKFGFIKGRGNKALDRLEVFFRTVGQALPHVGVDSSRYQPSCTAACHEGRSTGGPRGH